VEPEAHEATCADCIASEQNKDVVLEDPYFVRIWRSVQFKVAGIPVLELIDSLDDALAIQAVEAKIREIEIEKAKAEQQPDPRDTDE
jgi:hypothetical protein